jgi:hypothetical protein
MPRFLIEVSHPEERLACAKFVQVFLSTGSHYLSQSDWGCMDGDHRSWIIVEAADKEEAQRVVPPAFRAQAKVVGLNKFTLEQIESMMGQHNA